ncbi:MAG: hypothetical protein JWO05_1544 [Gemmatimonadetes bacterium]|nr:hypothetical protein [Gemmatimonadota bacterium]
MPHASPPAVDCDQQHPTLAVPDVRAAVDFWTTQLGFREAFVSGDPPDFAGVNLGNVQVFLTLGTPNPTGSSVYFVISDVQALYKFHGDAGVTIVEGLTDQPYGLRDYSVRDLNGYVLTFGQHSFNAGPPIEIERVDVPVRLETRLAALLADLAAKKGMSISSTLEETLLHTMEGAGPHTRSQLEYIQQLKAKHGIDYDSHGSYRFLER